MSTSRSTLLAPIIALVFALISIGFGDPVWQLGQPRPRRSTFLQIADVNIGLLVILGITSIGVYGIALAGWSSNNKYSLLGALRSSPQLVSYEVALGLSLVGVVHARRIAQPARHRGAQQATCWALLHLEHLWRMQFVAFFIYLMAAYAETNRSPFDLPEAESGTGRRLSHRVQLDEVRHVLHGRIRQHDYRGLRGHAAVFGRLDQPLRPLISFAEHRLLPVFWFALKVFFFLFLYIWVRGTLAALPL